MKLLSINVSPIREVQHEGRTVRTAIFKKPVSGRVHMGRLGLAGDDQADKRYHGGEHMAVYAITRETYDHWTKAEKRADLHWGLFGENLTVEGMNDNEVCIGDRFKIGEAEVEVSLPRGPCSTLAMAVGDTGFPKRFLSTCQVGFYLRVIREGTVGVGDEIVRSFAEPARLSIADVTRTYYFDTGNAAAAKRALGVAALGPAWRPKLEERVGLGG